MVSQCSWHWAWVSLRRLPGNSGKPLGMLWDEFANHTQPSATGATTVALGDIAYVSGAGKGLAQIGVGLGVTSW
jgi:hypothetical protein